MVAGSGALGPIYRASIVTLQGVLSQYLYWEHRPDKHINWALIWRGRCPESLGSCAAAGHKGVQAGPGAGVLHLRDAVQPGPVHGHVHTLRGVVRRGGQGLGSCAHAARNGASGWAGFRVYGHVHTLRRVVRRGGQGAFALIFISAVWCCTWSTQWKWTGSYPL